MKQKEKSTQKEKKTRKERWIEHLIPSLGQERQTDAEIDGLYRAYRKDSETTDIPEDLTDLIDKDMRRTRISPIDGMRRDYLNEKIEGEEIRKIITRILKVFSITNKSIGYVQGMNTICSIIYYVISKDQSVYSESITYFCFFYLMVDIGDYFTEKMDDTETGILGEKAKILKILKKTDKKLFKSVKNNDIFEKGSFHIRWMVLLFSAEFLLEDTLGIWDRFFCESPKRKMVPYFCASILIILRDRIISQKETEILSSLEIVRINPKEGLSLADTLLKSIPYNNLK